MKHIIFACALAGISGYRHSGKAHLKNSLLELGRLCRALRCLGAVQIHTGCKF
jgi:hypothetical protein